MKFVLIKTKVGKYWALNIDNQDDFEKFCYDKANDFTQAYLMAQSSVFHRGEVSHCGIMPRVIAMELEKHENRKSFVDDVFIYVTAFLKPFQTVFEKEGNILVWRSNEHAEKWEKQKYGGFMPFSALNSIGGEIVETLEKDVLEFPERKKYFKSDISVTKWEDGRHYYAKVGDIDVEIDGKRSWNTYGFAEQMAEEFLRRMNNNV